MQLEKEYYESHCRCPFCRDDDIYTRDSKARDRANRAAPGQDKGKARCMVCGWRGVVHDLTPRVMVKVAPPTTPEGLLELINSQIVLGDPYASLEEKFYCCHCEREYPVKKVRIFYDVAEPSEDEDGKVFIPVGCTDEDCNGAGLGCDLENHKNDPHWTGPEGADNEQRT